MPYDNRQTDGQRKAHRHPENIPRTPQQTGRPSAQNSNRVKSHPNTTDAYRFTADNHRNTYGRPPVSDRSGQGRRPAPRQTETSARQRAQLEAQKRVRQQEKKEKRKKEKNRRIAAYDERRIARYENKALVEVEREQGWQKDIVRVRGGVDKPMLGLILLLVCLGTIMVFSTSYPYAINEGQEDMYYYSKRQILFVALGLFVMFVASRVPYTWFKTGIGKLKLPFVIVFYLVAVVLLVLVLIMGSSEGVAKRWLFIGPISMQPSELMKVALIMMLAWYIDRFRKDIDSRVSLGHDYLHSTVLPAIPVVIACGLIVLEKHLSGTLITGIIGLAVMLIGGCHFWFTLMSAIGAGVVGGGLFVLLNEYAMERITTFFDKNADKLVEDYQTTQGLLAIGSGGLFGLGLGHSRQKYSYVAAAHTDFIFSIWCEETGFIGAVFLIALFIIFVIRGYQIAARAPDTFSSLVAYGISTHVGIQALMNMCVVTNIMPNTGVPLPFFSYGGSSLIVLLGEMGILLSISRQYYVKKADLETIQYE